MAHRKESVRPEAEIDYQATKDAEERIYAHGKKLYKKKGYSNSEAARIAKRRCS